MDKKELNLEEIIKNCQAGKTNDFGLVYDAYVKKIYAFIYQKTFNREVAEDLTSKTFLNSLKNIGQYDAEKANFNTWIYKIARNNVIDHYRARRDEIDIENVFDLAADSDIEADVGNRLILEKVRKQLENLEPRQKEIILLRLWDGLSYKEISALIGISAGNAKMIFSRSMSALRADMTAALLYLLLISSIWTNNN